MDNYPYPRELTPETARAQVMRMVEGRRAETSVDCTPLVEPMLTHAEALHASCQEDGWHTQGDEAGLITELKEAARNLMWCCVAEHEGNFASHDDLEAFLEQTADVVTTLIGNIHYAANETNRHDERSLIYDRHNVRFWTQRAIYEGLRSASIQIGLDSKFPTGDHSHEHSYNCGYPAGSKRDALVAKAQRCFPPPLAREHGVDAPGAFM
jgi:hypothetical protein